MLKNLWICLILQKNRCLKYRLFVLFRLVWLEFKQKCARSKKETPAEAGVVNLLEARPGFEPGIKALQASALPLGHLAI